MDIDSVLSKPVLTPAGHSLNRMPVCILQDFLLVDIRVDGFFKSNCRKDNRKGLDLCSMSLLALDYDHSVHLVSTNEIRGKIVRRNKRHSLITVLHMYLAFLMGVASVTSWSSQVGRRSIAREKERGSHISYMFRLPFAAGSVFSASMLDTLLYQAFVKDYLITFVRLLLGIDQAPGSGFLTSMKITKQDKWIRTYGRLYQKLCSTTCEIPMGIFRTIDTSNLEPSNNLASVFPALWKSAETFSNFPFSSLNPEFSLNISDDPKEGHSNQIERAEIAQLVRSRMTSLALPPESYDDVSEKRNSLSFVIINPSCDLNLEEGDIVYLIRPSPFSAQKTFERHNSRRKSNISLAETRRRSTTFTRPPPLHSAPKSTSLSLPDSPQISPGYLRGRSNSLRVDDILMRRSNSLRFGLEATRRINSFEELGVSPNSGVCAGGPVGNGERRSSIKIPANGSIGLEVTPPEESGSDASVPSIQLQGTIV
ncbi:hypothetical protein FHG87_006299 [Trinorchestia longiramus]|nr:hypothetical protein FHG87_006299 [Trinorchestia longiramus]